MNDEKEKIDLDKKQDANLHLSDTIKDAHASGDGALERSNEPIPEEKQENKIAPPENY